MAESLNVVYLHCHDLGRLIQPYGFNVPSPALQRFAEQSVVFRQAHACAPSCSPSRSAMLTGQYPHVCGMHGLASAYFGFKLNDYSKHLVRFLRDQGYETAIAGVQHEAHGPLSDPKDLGYERFLNHTPEGRPRMMNAIGPAATSFLAETHERPFFLSVGFNEPHRNNAEDGLRHSTDADIPPVDQLDGRYTRPPAPIPDTPRTRADWASFAAAVKRLDEKMGEVLDQIDRCGLREKTLVLLTTDHGIAWPHGKGNLTDWGTGVTFMMRGPTGSGFEGGRVIDALISQLDLFPTLCETMGFEAPDWLQGVSFLPLIDGRSEATREHVFTEQGWHGWGYDPQRAVRTQRYKYIRRKDVDHLRIVDPGPTNDWLAGLGYRERPRETELLYDLWFDPQEMHNLIDDPDYADVLTDLRGRVDKWIAETDDPFATDAIPEPVDATK